jgi:MFS family permease
MFGGSFVGLLLVPTNFHYITFAVLVFLNGVGGGMFSAPNGAAIMNSVPAEERGGAAGIQAAFLNTGFVLSIGIFFSLMIVGLTNTLPKAMFKGLSVHGVAAAQAHSIANLPPVGVLFSAFLGKNPVKNLLGSQATSHVTHSAWLVLTGKHFFPELIESSFHHGLVIVFGAAIVMSVVGAVASALRGERYVREDESMLEHLGDAAATSSAVPGEIALESDVVK